MAAICLSIANSPTTARRTVTRVYAGDGRLMEEYAQEKRVFVPVEAMPKRLIQAFLAAEDQHFYRHPGINPLSIVRAALANVERLVTNQRPVGASTITQQVAKNFLLTNEVSIKRKFKEALLALRIEETFTKDEILELYLNQIYLGLGSYGVAAAALNYFDKSLDELSTAEAAYLAGLPKAPSWYHPIRQPDAAKGRRDWVIGRMVVLGAITAEEAAQARAEPLAMRRRAPTEVAVADYFTEDVRRTLVEQHGDAFLYEGGLAIQTTLSPRLQTLADEALHDGLVAYDRRHGWRGPVATLELSEGWQSRLVEIDQSDGQDHWQLAMVLEVTPEAATLGFPDGSAGLLPLAELGWARAPDEKGNLGPKVTHPEQVVAPGDVIWVEPVAAEAGEEPDQTASEAAEALQFTLRQPPAVEGAVVAIDPHNGRVLAISGGYSFQRSVFNRATQALRQPGSALKPFIYLAGLDSGLTPSSIFLDAPIVIDPGTGTRQMEAGQLQQQVLWSQHLAIGSGEVAQRHDGASRPGGGHGPRGRHGGAVRSGTRPRPQSRCIAGRQRGRPPRADHRLRHAGQWRQADRARLDRADPGSSRQDRAAPRRARMPRVPRRCLARSGHADPGR